MAIALALAAPASAQSVKAGIDAWQRADYDSAVKIWRPLAEAGDADASFNLGQAYRLGRGVPIGLAAAQTWLERAARKGHLDAQTTLGLLLFNGGNRISGLRWLRMAAEQGEPRALLIYGTALFNGDGVVRDPVLAYAYVSRAAAQGLAPAQATLAEMDKLVPLDERRKGVAMAQNLAKAAETEPARAKQPIAPKPRAGATAESAQKSPAKTAVKPSATGAEPAPARASGPWRIQLGAFSRRGSAEALFNKLAGRGQLAGRRPFYVAAGAVTRLQIGPFESRAAAAAACAALSRQGQPCFPVAAK
ncbi:SPOR domain-containing protein [Sphingomonas sp.]|uniref:SPOR domain-containing protein n=1 Tax=Sphingomonas sp. TaxID=28214 RepID=UPI0025FE3793|nr:SPOR domain-containing protein [Sphingomonas sp.]